MLYYSYTNRNFAVHNSAIIYSDAYKRIG